MRLELLVSDAPIDRAGTTRLRLGLASWRMARPRGLLALGTLLPQLVTLALADLLLKHPQPQDHPAGCLTMRSRRRRAMSAGCRLQWTQARSKSHCPK
jgi:hypothetical protein